MIKISTTLKIFIFQNITWAMLQVLFSFSIWGSIILTADGVGEWATTTIAHGKDNRVEILEEIHFPHSLGLLYSAFTYYTGFKVNGGEYKLMGLAPYGQPIYENKIIENLIDIKDDGSFNLNQDYFNYATGLQWQTKIW